MRNNTLRCNICFWSTFRKEDGSTQHQQQRLPSRHRRGGTGCWAVEVSYAHIELPFSIGQTVADATDDVAI